MDRIVRIVDNKNGNSHVEVDMSTVSVVTLDNGDVRLKIGNNQSSKQKLTVTYSCTSCDTHTSISIESYCRKLSKQDLRCQTCLLINNGCRNEGGSGSASNLDLCIQQAKLAFDKCGPEYSKTYFHQWLSFDEFDYIKSNIVGFVNDDTSQYIPYFRYPVQKQGFYPVLRNGNTVHPLHKLHLMCQGCNKQFVMTSHNQLKNVRRVLCSGCNPVNKKHK